VDKTNQVHLDKDWEVLVEKNRDVQGDKDWEVLVVKTLEVHLDEDWEVLGEKPGKSWDVTRTADRDGRLVQPTLSGQS
jgi:hypothetical protein